MRSMRSRPEETTFNEDGGNLGERMEQAVEHVRQRLGEAAAEEFVRQMEPGESVEEAAYESAGKPFHNGEEEHVIDLGGRLRRAWKHWQFRLLLLTLALALSASAANAQVQALPQIFGFLSLFLFGAWSLAQFRQQGLAQILVKWLVYCGTFAIGAALADVASAEMRTPAILGVLAVALVLTLSKFSIWLGVMIHAHIWESRVVRIVRGWF